MSDSDYHYVVYIDEAGDPGLRAVRPLDEKGSPEWLVLAAVILRTCYENDVPSWADAIKHQAGLNLSGPIHFRNLSSARRLIVAEKISSLPIRAFAVCSNKKNMRGYINPRAEKVSSQQWFYNWCLRLILERVTAFCDERRNKDYPGLKCRIKVVFSKRKGHSYSQTRAYAYYLRYQQQAGSVFLKKRMIQTDLLSRDLMLDLPNDETPGLQLADVVASAFFSAANTIGPGEWDIRPAIGLEKIMASEQGTIADFGVALQPTNLSQAKLTNEQMTIFKHFGYNFN
jgi:hypothetical protein